MPSNFIELIINPHDLPEHTKHQIQKLTGKNFSLDEGIVRRREQTLSLDSDVFTTNTPPAQPIVRKAGERHFAELNRRSSPIFLQSTAARLTCPMTISPTSNTVNRTEHALV